MEYFGESDRLHYTLLLTSSRGCDCGVAINHSSEKMWYKSYDLSKTEMRNTLRKLKSLKSKVQVKESKNYAGYKISSMPRSSKSLEYHEVSYEHFVNTIKVLDSITEARIVDFIDLVDETDFYAPSGASL